MGGGGGDITPTKGEAKHKIISTVSSSTFIKTRRDKTDMACPCEPQVGTSDLYQNVIKSLPLFIYKCLHNISEI
jgi:hypothetical protein